MKKWILMAAVGSVFAAQAAMAGTIVLNFDQLKDKEPVQNYYAGGLAGFGTGPGPNYGLTFQNNALAITSGNVGGSGNFDGNPSGNNTLSFVGGTGDIMNVAGGFTTGFSFFYSAPFNTGTVTVWSGPDATGTELADIALPMTPYGVSYGPPCSDEFSYCPWVAIGVSFSGIAGSVDFGGTANEIAFDNITLGSSQAQTPEPASLMLFGSGLLGVLGTIRLRRSEA